MSKKKNEPSLKDELWMGVMAFEAKSLTTDECNAWFSELVKTGYVWKLPPYYVEYAASLLNHGVIGNPKRELDS